MEFNTATEKAPAGRNRIKVPGMLLLGSAARNSGKTELACLIIGRMRAEAEIIGLKVTTVHNQNGLCPRGGEGCGVCSSLGGKYHISEETDLHSGKDTSRLLAAGAVKVYWLRSMHRHLREGIENLLDMIEADAVTVTESNSISRFVDPGLFLMVRENGSLEIKSSAQAALPYVDRTVFSDGRNFDLDVNHLAIFAGKWILREATAGIIAGGRSLRMQRDKSLLPIRGRPMIQHIADQLTLYFNEIIINASAPEKYTFLEARVAPDKIPGQGPLMGISAVLKAAQNEKVFVVACDIPDINLDFVRRLLAEASHYDCVIPISGQDELEPLFAVYRKSVLPVVDDLLESGKRQIRLLYPRVKTKYLAMGKADWYRNLNTITDFKNYQRSPVGSTR